MYVTEELARAITEDRLREAASRRTAARLASLRRSERKAARAERTAAWARQRAGRARIRAASARGDVVTPQRGDLS